MSNNANENLPAPGRRGYVAPSGVLAIAMILAVITGRYTDWQTAVTVFTSVLALYTGRRTR